MTPGRLVPALDWLPAYRRQHLTGDLKAGLTVGVMLIPQGMAYALLAGAPPVFGLYASLIPLLVYTFLGTSRHLAVGIVAIDSLMVLAAVNSIATPGSEGYTQAVLVLALMTGLFQLGLGLARFGFIVTLLSRPVISGFASAAALTIGMSQLPGLLGSPLTGPPNAVAILLQSGDLLSHTHLWSAAIGLASVAIILLIRRVRPSIPAGLIVVVLGILTVWLLGLDGEGVRVVGAIPSGLPKPALPRATGQLIRELLPLALTLGLVQFTILISLGKLFAARHRYRVDPNKELIALGGMNAVGSFFGSVPVSASFSRTAVNEATGARSPAANLVAAALIAITLLFLTPLFFYLPIPVFSAIILVAALALVDVAEVRLLLRTKRIDGLIAIVTFAATLFIGIQEGIVAGILASITAILFRITRPDVVELGHLRGTRLYRDLDRRPDAQRLPGVYILRFDASFSFVNADYIRDHLLAHLESNPDVAFVLLDATSINDLDMTAADVLGSLHRTLASRGVRLLLSGVKGRVKDVLDASGLTEQMGNDSTFLSAHRAVLAILESQGSDESTLDVEGGD